MLNTLCLRTGIGPEEVAEQALVRDVGGPLNDLDLLQGGEFGGEAAVHAQDAVVDQRRHGQAVEALREGLPEFDGVAPATFN